MPDLSFSTPPAVCPVCGSEMLSHPGPRRRGYPCGLELLAKFTWAIDADTVNRLSREPTSTTWEVSRQCGEAMETALALRAKLDEMHLPIYTALTGLVIDDTLRAASAERAGER